MRASCRFSGGHGRGNFRRGVSGEFAEYGQEFAFGNGQAEPVGTQMLLRRDDYVHGRHFMLMEAEKRAQDTLDAVPFNSVAAFFSNGKP